MDLSDEGITERYAEYCASGISLDDMRNTLAYENDVKPVRLDTDIYHQSPERTRSAVEIVSNAIDAMNKTGITIGRFGVGFYQILSHLKDGDDYVKVTTGNEQAGFYEISFKLEGKEIKFHLQEAGENRKNGTTVELHVKDFPKDEAEDLVKKHFAYNSNAKVKCNDKQVNDLKAFGISQAEQNTVEIKLSESGFVVADTGIGMSPQVILEKLLVPKISGKKPIQEMMDVEIHPTYMVERGGDKSFTGGKAVINVGGVVIDLPPFTLLGEERNQVAVDEITIKAMKRLIDEIVTSGDIQAINSLAQTVSIFRNRSTKHSKESDLIFYLQNSAENILPKDKYYMSNSEGMDRIEIEGVELLDTNVITNNWAAIPDLNRAESHGEGMPVYVAKLKEDIKNPVVRWRNRLILSKEIYDKYKDDQTLLNLYLQHYADGEGVKGRRISRDAGKGAEAGVEMVEKNYESFNGYVLDNWEILGFSNQDTAKVWIDLLDDNQKQAIASIEQYILNKFPTTFTKYFIDAVFHKKLDSLTEDNLKKISSLASSESLRQLLDDLNIKPLQTDEQEIQYFPGISSGLSDPFPDRYNDRTRPFKREDQKYVGLRYWERKNTIKENGEVIKGEPIYIEGIDLLYIDGNLIDPLNGEKFLGGIELREGERVSSKGIVWGGKKYLVLATDEREQHYYYINTRIIDVETGKIFNPEPNLGIPVEKRGLNNELEFLVFCKKTGGKVKKDSYSNELIDEVELSYLLENGTVLKDEEINQIIDNELLNKILPYEVEVEGKMANIILSGKVLYTFKKDEAHGRLNGKDGEDWKMHDFLSCKLFNIVEKNGHKYLFIEEKYQTGETRERLKVQNDFHEESTWKDLAQIRYCLMSRGKRFSSSDRRKELLILLKMKKEKLFSWLQMLKQQTGVEAGRGGKMKNIVRENRLFILFSGLC